MTTEVSQNTWECERCGDDCTLEEYDCPNGMCNKCSEELNGK